MMIQDHLKRYYGSRLQDQEEYYERSKYYIESEEEKAKREFDQYYLYFVDKPIVDFIRTQEKFQRQKVAYALHQYANQWLKDNFGLHLWLSYCRTDDGKCFYDSNLLQLKKYRYKQKMTGGFRRTREYMAKSNNLYKMAESENYFYKDETGYIKGTQLQDGYFFVEEFVIYPEYRGKGKGKELAKHLPQKCKLLANPLWKLDKGDKLDQGSLIEFYEGLGFTLDEEEFLKSKNMFMRRGGIMNWYSRSQIYKRSQIEGEERDKMGIVSFDFDNTVVKYEWDDLDYYKKDFNGNYIYSINSSIVQLMNKEGGEGNRIYIVTSRFERLKGEIEGILGKEGIKVDGIYCTNGKDKIETLIKLGIKRHYDDDIMEISLINRKGTGVEGILVS